MSQTIQADAKALVASKVQTKLKYTQTKLDLSTFSIKDTVETKSDTKQDNKAEYKSNDDCKHIECEEIKEDVIPDIPPVLTVPEIKRVLCVEGVTKISMDLETASRGRFDSNLGHMTRDIVPIYLNWNSN